jgi:uncharacterized protein YjdB
MRQNNDFNKYPLYPDEPVEANMDHRVGVNEDIKDAVAYNGAKHEACFIDVDQIKNNDQLKYEKNATAISLGDAKTIKVNEAYTPEIITTPFIANIPALVWTSSNTKVATVVNGTIFGVGIGTATITATSPYEVDESAITASVAITVA